MDDISAQIAYQVTCVAQALREHDLYRPPGVAGTLAWAAALVAMHRADLDEATSNGYAGRAAEASG